MTCECEQLRSRVAALEYEVQRLRAELKFLEEDKGMEQDYPMHYWEDR